MSAGLLATIVFVGLVLLVGLAAMSYQMVKLNRTVNEKLRETELTYQEAYKSLGERIEGQTSLFGQVQRSLGQLQESYRQITEIARDIAALQDLLRAPKLRGELGEFLLEDILSQVLPPEFYKLQHRFKSGEVADAVVKFKDGMVAIDAKFPLENFQRLIRSESEPERRESRRKFVSDVKKHIDSIAEKYIKPDEGTFDFALMYVPAENVYYEIIIKDETEKETGFSPLKYAQEKRVMPVSPSSFYAYLRAIATGLKGMKIEKAAREVLDALSRLRGEFAKFQEEFEKLGKHLHDSTSTYDKASKRLEKIDDRMEKIESLHELPQAEAEQVQIEEEHRFN